MSENARRPSRDLTTGELTARLGEQLSQLVRDEIALAKAELAVSTRQAVLGAGMLGGAAVCAVAGLAVMIAAAVAAVALKLPTWAAALIVGGAFLVVAGVVALLAIRRLSRGFPPLKETTDTIRGDVTVLKSRVRR
jgi:predicted phage tail protein